MGETRDVPIDDLTIDPDNAMAHPDENLDAIKASLERFGSGRSIVIDSSDTIRAGNGTVEAARAAGFKRVLVVEPDADQLVAVKRADWSESEAKGYGVADNRTAQLAKFDVPALQSVISSIPDVDLADMGFTESAFQSLIDSVTQSTNDPESAGSDEGAVPDPPAAPVTQLGDVWLLGRHRLYCADNAKVNVSGSGVDLVFTSPPYDQQRDYGEASDVSDWYALMRGAFGNLPVKDSTQVLVNLGLVHDCGEWNPYWDEWIDWMRDKGWRRFGWYVWDQGWGLPGDWSGRLAPSFEFVFHFNRSPVRPKKIVESKLGGETTKGKKGLRGKNGQVSGFTHAKGPNAEYTYPDTKIPDSVIRENRQCGTVNHPAPFSVSFARFILSAWPGKVYDPFLGSGTTLIAAEQLGLDCIGIEVEPKYCDVIVERWTNLTGDKAQRVAL